MTNMVFSSVLLKWPTCQCAYPQRRCDNLFQNVLNFAKIKGLSKKVILFRKGSADKRKDPGSEKRILDQTDKTSMGGLNEAFDPTPWTDIDKIQNRDTISAQQMTGDLLKRYWKPVYCYLLRKGHPNETAKDLTQGFFHEVVLGRSLIHKADREKGRFRTFILTVLDRYLISVHRGETAKKRKPVGGMVQLEGIDTYRDIELIHSFTPIEAFNYTWASELLDQVLADVEKECLKNGQETHWQVFHAKIAQPIMSNTEPPSLAEICSKYRVESESKASNMIVTVKRRFQGILAGHLRKFMLTDSEIDAEISDLMKILSKSGAG